MKELIEKQLAAIEAADDDGARPKRILAQTIQGTKKDLPAYVTVNDLQQPLLTYLILHYPPETVLDFIENNNVPVPKKNDSITEAVWSQMDKIGHSLKYSHLKLMDTLLQKGTAFTDHVNLDILLLHHWDEQTETGCDENQAIIRRLLRYALPRIKLWRDGFNIFHNVSRHNTVFMREAKAELERRIETDKPIYNGDLGAFWRKHKRAPYTDETLKGYMTETDGSDETALQRAVKANNLEAVTLFIEMGAVPFALRQLPEDDDNQEYLTSSDEEGDESDTATSSDIEIKPEFVHKGIFERAYNASNDMFIFLFEHCLADINAAPEALLEEALEKPKWYMSQNSHASLDEWQKSNTYFEALCGFYQKKGIAPELVERYQQQYAPIKQACEARTAEVEAHIASEAAKAAERRQGLQLGFTATSVLGAMARVISSVAGEVLPSAVVSMLSGARQGGGQAQRTEVTSSSFSTLGALARMGSIGAGLTMSGVAIAAGATMIALALSAPHVLVALATTALVVKTAALIGVSVHSTIIGLGAAITTVGVAMGLGVAGISKHHSQAVTADCHLVASQIGSGIRYAVSCAPCCSPQQNAGYAEMREQQP